MNNEEILLQALNTYGNFTRVAQEFSENQLQVIYEAMELVKNNAVLQHTSNIEAAVCNPSMCDKLEAACMFHDPCFECELNKQTDC